MFILPIHNHSKIYFHKWFMFSGIKKNIPRFDKKKNMMLLNLKGQFLFVSYKVILNIQSLGKWCWIVHLSDNNSKL